MDAQKPEIDTRLDTTSTDSRVGVMTNDDGKYIRTAVQLSADTNSGSIDIIDREGRLVCRLNLFQFDDSFDVDVIPVTQRSLLRAFCLEQGHEVFTAHAPDGCLIAVIGTVPPIVQPRPGIVKKAQ